MFVVVFCVAISVCVCVGLNLRIHDKKTQTKMVQFELELQLLHLVGYKLLKKYAKITYYHLLLHLLFFASTLHPLSPPSKF